MPGRTFRRGRTEKGHPPGMAFMLSAVRDLPGRKGAPHGHGPAGFGLRAAILQGRHGGQELAFQQF